MGLKADGTTVAVGDNDDGQCNVDYRKNIIQVAVGGASVFGVFQHTVGLECDDTVVAVRDDSQGQCNVSASTNIIQVAAGGLHTVGR